METNKTSRYWAEIELGIANCKECTDYYEKNRPLVYLLQILILWMCLQAFLMVIFMPWDGVSYVSMALAISLGYLGARLFHVRRGRNGNLYYRRAVLGNNGSPPRNTILFKDDGILMLNLDTGNQNAYRYDQIRALIETENLLIIELDYRMCLFVEKTCVSGGSFREFTVFLLEKAVNISKKRILYSRFGTLLSSISVGCTVFTVVMAFAYLTIMLLIGG